MIKKVAYLSITIFALFMISCQSQSKKIDLSGKWQVALDSLDKGISESWYEKSFNNEIILPGTLCEAGYGNPCTLDAAMEKEIFLNLKRRYDYIGPAWYKREVTIPQDWKDNSIVLSLERVIWNSQVWIDGKKVSTENESLTAPHIFDLTEYLQPGKHTLTIRIDNRKKHDITARDMGHAYTNETQTMWNGILGDISLEARSKTYIDELNIYPENESGKLKVRITLNGEIKNSQPHMIKFRVEEKGGKRFSEKQIEIIGNEINFEYAIDNPKLWNEFSPNLYEAVAKLESGKETDIKTVDFGIRMLTNNNSELQINKHRLFLRGTLECCIFPLKGYPPTGREEWKNVFNAAKLYGLNHLRFHSWCPPKAAFEVADRMGFYLQVELPYWQLNFGSDEKTVSFLKQEAEYILREYGNHPSFCFLAMGNEIQGNMILLGDMMLDIKKKDPRHLYSSTAFTFEQPYTEWPTLQDDFWISQWTKKGWVRGQGVFDSEAPDFMKDYIASIDSIPVPIITHEIGQYSVFPNLKEIEKYTGNLMPLNFIAVKNDLEKKGRLNEADKYLLGSGKLAAILYKEEIERALKTPGISGFQLLDLHDFPGQGTALVGLLDAFWDSKGLITPEEFRMFCAPVVPLLRFPKATYKNNEIFDAGLEIVNFGDKDLKDILPVWNLKDKAGKVVANGEISRQSIIIGSNQKMGNIKIPLSSITTAGKFTITVSLDKTNYLNKWDIWVYPESLPDNKGNIFLTQSFEEAQAALDEGKSVLLNPKKEDLKGLEGKFVQVFWSPVHFPNQPGTMGILCEPTHPALADFPTEMHSNWQWWDICKNGKTMILDSLDSSIRPIVTMIDNFYKNRNLGLIFEVKSGSGKLLICSTDLSSELDNRLVAKQLQYSLFNYMNSSNFNPQKELSFDKIKASLHNVNRIEEKKKSIYSD